jgi:carboxyl-terminal processing protease
MRKVLMFPLLLVLPIALLGCKYQQQASTLDPMTAVASNAPSAAPMSGRASSHGGSITLAPTGEEGHAARLVYGLLSDSQFHYRPLPLDDAMSAQIFKRYLDALDADKLFFNQADINRFAPYRTGLDDAIKSEHLQPAFDIFNVYLQRIGERVAFARALLKQDFDFNGKDGYTWDRKNAVWAADSKALDQLWRAYVKNDVLRLKLAGKSMPEIRKTLDKRYSEVESRARQLTGEDVFQTFLDAYANSLDPHTDYMTPRAAENFSVSMRLSLEGIGAVLQKQDDYVVVRSIVPGGPADKSGKIKVGDRIAAVGQGGSGAMEDVVGWRIDDVVDKIRGARNTQVRLDVLPAAVGTDGKHVLVALTRQRVKLEEQAAKDRVIEVGSGAAKHRVGVIELPTFYEDFDARRRNDPNYVSATRDVAKLLVELKAKKVDGVVLDLRDNGGGSLSEAIELTGLFIGSGPVVQVREAGGNVDVQNDEDSRVAWNGPLAVLVNRGSASASEIFAAAIQDYGRGLIIGEGTFGKGTVQNLIDLDRIPHPENEHYGQVKLTVAEFFRVNGGSTQHKGVLPDIAFPTSIDSTEYGESTFDNALPYTQIKAADYRPLSRFASLLPLLAARHDVRVKTDREYQWWAQDVAEFRADRAKKVISLNLAVRAAERDKKDAQRKQRDVERKALGLDVPDDRADDGLQADERNVADEAKREKAAKDRISPLQREAAAILGDAIDLLAGNSQLSALVLPQQAHGAWSN